MGGDERYRRERCGMGRQVPCPGARLVPGGGGDRPGSDDLAGFDDCAIVSITVYQLLVVCDAC